MAFDPKEFANSIVAGVQIDPATKSQLEQLLANPALSAKFAELHDGNLRQSEFSKKMTEYESKIKSAQEYWDGLNKWDKDTKGKLETELAQLREQLTGDGAGLPNAPNKEVVDYKAELQKLAQEAVAYNNMVMQTGLRHFKEYGEILNTDDVLKIAADERLNFSQAYHKFIEPKREALQKADLEKQLVAAREEGRIEALKNANLPSSSQPLNPSQPDPLGGLNGSGRDGSEPKFGSMAAIRAFSENRAKGIPVG